MSAVVSLVDETPDDAAASTPFSLNAESGHRAKIQGQRRLARADRKR
jgi:hypothetical protein